MVHWVASGGLTGGREREMQEGGKRWGLRQVSIVLLLPQQQQTDPQTVNPESLARHGIVSESWEPTNVVALPVFALTEYPNGLSIRAEPNRLVFQEQITDSFQRKYHSHTAARKYAEASRMMPYQAVGMNWVMVPPDYTTFMDNLAAKLNPALNAPPDYLPAAVHLFRQVNGNAWNIIFNKDNQHGVELNYHAQLRDETPMDVIDRLDELQQTVQTELLPIIQAW